MSKFHPNIIAFSQVAADAGACDEEGWQYRIASGSFSNELRPSNPTGQQGWTAAASPASTWRRRRWLRHRRKRPQQVFSASDPLCKEVWQADLIKERGSGGTHCTFLCSAMRLARTAADLGLVACARAGAGARPEKHGQHGRQLARQRHDHDRSAAVHPGARHQASRGQGAHSWRPRALPLFSCRLHA